jgi:hypothetical protein
MPGLSPSTAPHLYLGVNSAADKAQAGIAFALATKRLKNDPSVEISLQDLTSALSTAERRGDAALGLCYWVPANADALQSQQTDSASDQDFSAQSDLLQIDWEAFDSPTRERFAAMLLRTSIQKLHSWKWKESVQLSQMGLRVSRNEDTRDELLNVIAASFAMLGDSRKSMDALLQAVAGKWNLNLQTNLVLVAMGESPETAVEHLSHLILGASTVEERLGACNLASEIWGKINQNREGNTELPLPAKVSDAFYDLLTQPGLSEKDFFSLGISLADSNPDEFKKRKIVSKSAHRISVSGRLLDSAARDFGEFALELVKAENLGQLSNKQWLQDRLDSMVDSLNDLFISSEVREKPVNFAFGLIDGGLKCRSLERVSLLAFMVWNLSDVFTDENDVPKDEFVKWIESAYDRFREAGAFSDRQKEQVDLVKGFVQSALNSLLFLYARGYWNMAIEVEKNVNGILRENAKWFPDRSGIQSASREIVNWCDSALSASQSLRRRCDDKDLNDHVDELLKYVNQFRNSVVSLR